MLPFFSPRYPRLNVELVSWYITKSCFGVVYNIELGGGGETKCVLSMFNDFVIILAGMVSRILYMIAAYLHYNKLPILSSFNSKPSWKITLLA
jgi:hypothetical protein